MLKKLKSLFVIEDENPKSSEKPTDQKVQEPDKKLSDSVIEETGNTKKTTSGSGTPEEKFINRLLSALEENNLKGFDYLEYKQALQNLNSVDMDEPTRYKSALAMASTMGASSAGLIKSAQHYLKVLKNEEKKFLDAFKNQQAKMVSSRENELVELEKSISLKLKQIEKLQKEIEANKATLEKKRKQANHATAKVQSTKENFYASFNIVADQISSDIKNMTNYLQ